MKRTYSIIALVAALGGVAVAVWVSGALDRGEPFPMNAYLEAPGNFAGNSYSIDGTIQGLISQRGGVGRLIQVRDTVSGEMVAVFLPEAIEQNIEFGQRYRLEVRVETGGRLEVRNMRKL